MIPARVSKICAAKQRGKALTVGTNAMPLTKRYFSQQNDKDLLTLQDWGGYFLPSAVLCVAAKEEKAMRKTLEDLYYGEIRPHDLEIDVDSEQGKP